MLVLVPDIVDRGSCILQSRPVVAVVDLGLVAEVVQGLALDAKAGLRDDVDARVIDEVLGKGIVMKLLVVTYRPMSGPGRR